MHNLQLNVYVHNYVYGHTCMYVCRSVYMCKEECDPQSRVMHSTSPYQPEGRGGVLVELIKAPRLWKAEFVRKVERSVISSPKTLTPQKPRKGGKRWCPYCIRLSSLETSECC